MSQTGAVLQCIEHFPYIQYIQVWFPESHMIPVVHQMILECIARNNFWIALGVTPSKEKQWMSLPYSQIWIF